MPLKPNQTVRKLLVLDKNTWKHINISKLFVSGMVTWSYKSSQSAGAVEYTNYIFARG